MSKERYLNCKYLDAGMDGMLCSKDLCKTCLEFNGEKCSYYTPKNESKDKEKQIEEMKNNARIYIGAVVEKLRMDGCELYEIDGIVENILNYITLPEDSVVLPKEEYQKDFSGVSMERIGNACLGTGCNKAFKCTKYVGNKPKGIYCVEEYASFGSGKIYSDGHIEENYRCGERGNYAMFEDKDKEKQLVNEIKQDFKMHEEKYKQIEEMAKIIALEMCPTQKEYSKFNNKATCYFAECKNIKNAVDKLTNAGYRKLLEDSVVITNDFELPFANKDECEYWKSRCKEIGDIAEENASKETAEKILNELYCTPKEKVENKIKELAKQFGVEIKE